MRSKKVTALTRFGQEISRTHYYFSKVRIAQIISDASYIPSSCVQWRKNFFEVAYSQFSLDGFHFILVTSYSFSQKIENESRMLTIFFPIDKECGYIALLYILNYFLTKKNGTMLRTYDQGKNDES